MATELSVTIWDPGETMERSDLEPFALTDFVMGEPALVRPEQMEDLIKVLVGQRAMFEMALTSTDHPYGEMVRHVPRLSEDPWRRPSVNGELVFTESEIVGVVEGLREANTSSGDSLWQFAMSRVAGKKYTEEIEAAKGWLVMRESTGPPSA